ncbi:MAG: HAD-IIIA family hydrolase [Lentisphaeria bacterium]
MTLQEKAENIKAVILDIDGVLTDGRVGYNDTEDEIKFFDVKDGHAIKLLMRGHIKVGVLSGRISKANQTRAAELGLHFMYENEKNKREAFNRVLCEQKLTPEECLYIGDDLVDLPVLRRAGIGVAVGDAVPEIRDYVDWITQAPGGRGAIRETAVWLLKMQGKWNDLIERYMRE